MREGGCNGLCSSHVKWLAEGNTFGHVWQTCINKRVVYLKIDHILHSSILEKHDFAIPCGYSHPVLNIQQAYMATSIEHITFQQQTPLLFSILGRTAEDIMYLSTWLLQQSKACKHDQTAGCDTVRSARIVHVSHPSAHPGGAYEAFQNLNKCTCLRLLLILLHMQ